MNLRIFFISLGILFLVVIGMIGLSTYRYYEAIHSDDPVTPTLSVEE